VPQVSAAHDNGRKNGGHALCSRLAVSHALVIVVLSLASVAQAQQRPMAPAGSTPIEHAAPGTELLWPANAPEGALREPILRRGRDMGLISVGIVGLSIGMIMGDIFYMLCAVYGLALVAHELGGFFIIVRVLGAAYLVYLGLKLWRHGADLDLAVEQKDPGGLVRTFAVGFLTTLGNPKAIAFYIGFLPNFIDVAVLTITDVAILAGTIFAAALLVCSLYAGLAARARGFLATRHYRRLVNRAAGTVMIGAGIAVAVR